MKKPVATPVLSLADGLAPGPDGFTRLAADDRTWICLAMGCAAGMQDLLSVWIDGNDVCMALGVPAAGRRFIVSFPLRRNAYPSVARNHAPALRLERALRDLKGVEPLGLTDQRPWLDHGRFPAPPPGQRRQSARPQGPYPFLAAEGDGLHQIPVGPVHAGIIEPGHFRFTANGEAVVRLEERLGYVHKGVEALCTGADIATAARVAARISGDSTVAYSFAFALAVEAALGWEVPPRAALLRAIMAELERLAHHLGDIGAICNDASVVVIQAHCAILRENVLRTAGRCFGHRLMMDRIVPGGTACDLSPEGAREITALAVDTLERFEAIVRVYDEAPSLQDRTVTTGRLSAALAAQYAAGGYVGRASGRAFDTRADYPYPPYGAFRMAVAHRQDGDVDARVWVRIEEVRSSIALLRDLIRALEPGSHLAPMPAARAGAGAAMVEAFRGDVFMALRLDGDARLAAFHARDASWFQWPLLEAAIEGNIVADFPLCNKSFNCSYSGHDM
jgi:Ni,Fe-hydrogenase III large subunit